MEDTDIIKLYFDRSEDAIKETDHKYHTFLHMVIHNILRDERDSEEILDDTYMGAWNAIPPTIPESLKYFLSRIARNLSLDRLDYRLAGKRNAQLVELDECIPDNKRGVEEEMDVKVIGEVLNHFLGTLDKKDCAVFLGRYYYCYTIEELADQYGMTKRQVKYLLSKERKELRALLEQEGITV